MKRFYAIALFVLGAMFEFAITHAGNTAYSGAMIGIILSGIAIGAMECGGALLQGNKSAPRPNPIVNVNNVNLDTCDKNEAEAAIAIVRDVYERRFAAKADSWPDEIG